ncbi:MAG: hypothetical protein K5856_08560 [Bacteroidaceae bacterium]|nr:hypothetical protein [Bacteroidaceae bacterium]
MISGRNRRLYAEWQLIEKRLVGRQDISYEVKRFNEAGMPVEYLVYYRLKSISGVDDVEHLNEPGACNAPQFETGYWLSIELPDGYPSVDAPPVFRFLTEDERGKPIPHPWHPNIRYFGDFAGRVCINMADTYTDLVWGVLRIADYLRYEIYHAVQEPPYPEDMKVALWVVRQGEPNGWIFFNQ